MNSIQIFACDHRKNVQWDLPYIRLGSKNSDAIFNIKYDNEILKFDPYLSEGAQILYVANHLSELGNPKYVGFVHYRRFFSFVINQWILNISNTQFNSQMCASPFQIALYLEQNKSDGISIMPFNIVNPIQHKFVGLIDQLKYLMTNEFNCPNQIIDDAFDIFLANCGELSTTIKQTFDIEAQYVCNIFVLESSLFKQYATIIHNTIKKLIANISNDQLNKMHPRFMGYILERFTSCYLYAIQKIGKKISHVPLLTIDAHIHQKWENNA